ncbi:MAG: hypothetical protein HY738_20890, partial [Bacteroidia bacterium]|nr:hypothetical protein [Bacteroidia bacterium]
MGTGYGKWNWENIKKRQFFLFIPILILAALVFQKTLNYNLLDIWDDQFNVTNNAKIKSITPQNLTTIFSSQHLAHYQPFKLLTYAFIYFISGDNPMPFHLTNLIFHLVNIILVFHLVYLLSNSRFTSFITGILFSVHPMFVETVCWVSGLNNILCAFFYILSLILYICYIKNGTKPKYLLLTFLFFICALLSKSLAVTLPLVLLVIDFYYNRRLNFRLIIEKIPFLVLSFLFGLIAILAAYNFGSVTDSQLIHRDGYNLVFFTSYA